MTLSKQGFTVLAEDLQFLAGQDDQAREIVWAAYVDPRYDDVGIIQGLKDGLVGGEVPLWDDISWRDCEPAEISALTQQKINGGFTEFFRGTLYFDPNEERYFVVDQDADHYLNKDPDPDSPDDKYHVDRNKIPDHLDFRK